MKPPESAPPHDVGRDGISGSITPDRALRAREVSRPAAEDLAEAEQTADRLLARLEKRHPRRRRR